MYTAPGVFGQPFLLRSTRSSFSFAINVVVFGVFDPVAAAHLMSGYKTRPGGGGRVVPGGRRRVQGVCVYDRKSPEPTEETRQAGFYDKSPVQRVRIVFF